MHLPHHTRSPSPETPDKAELTEHQRGAAAALQATVEHSTAPANATSSAGILAPADNIRKGHEGGGWLRSLIPGIERLTADEDYGNFVVVNRQTGEKTWESMPIYVRAGMSLLFTGEGDKLLGTGYINNLLLKQSIKQGKAFDSEAGALEHIQSFVQTYALQDSLAELANPDLASYRTFNQFFSRALKPGARPPAAPQDPSVVVSAADCRLTVWQDVPTATEFWIKGKQFTLAKLLQDDSISSHPDFAEGASLAIFRLAPQDYHRWHSPLAGTLGPVREIPGSLYTVNPMAVRNKDVDVYTANKRAIQLLSVPPLAGAEGGAGAGAPVPLPIVSIGAMLVGSIGYTRQPGAAVAKAEELGFFAYGGSTVIAVFPKGYVQFDQDLVQHSKQQLETLVKVGERIGQRLR